MLLTKDAVENFNKSISLIIHNQEIIEINERFQLVLFFFNHYMQTQNVSPITTNKLTISVVNLENIIIRNNTLHRSIVTKMK